MEARVRIEDGIRNQVTGQTTFRRTTAFRSKMEIRNFSGLEGKTPDPHVTLRRTRSVFSAGTGCGMSSAWRGRDS
jgi:hypothetical protein